MERRIPLVLPTLCIVGWVVIIDQIRLPDSSAWISVGCVGLALISLKRGFMALAFHLACGAIGLVAGHHITSHVVRASNAFGPLMKVRAEGVVRVVQRSSPGQFRYVLQGEVDATDLPCVRTTCIVTEWVEDSSRPRPRVGERRIVTGLLRRPDPATLPDEVPESAICNGSGASFLLLNASSVCIQEQPLLYRWADSCRHWIVAVLENHLPRDVSGIAIAVVIGDRTAVDHQAMQAYAASGTAHMFSVSGSHVGIILGVLVVLLGTAPSWWRVVLISLVIAGYVFISGAEPPAVRAGMMGVIALIARKRELHVDMLNILSGVALAIILFDPTISLQPGMVLSVMAMAAILGLGPLWFNRVMKLIDRPTSWKRAIVATCATSVAATVGVSIPSLVYFSSTSLTAPFANLIVVPLLSCALVACLLLCVTSVFGITTPVAWCICVVIRTADWVAHEAGEQRLAHLADEWKWIVVGLMICVLLWPLRSPTLIGGVIRVIFGIVVISTVIVCLPVKSTTGLIAVRRNGIVLAAVIRDTLCVVIDGSRHAAIDGRVLQWMKRQPLPVQCEGRGVWGRRMSARIRRELVGSKYEIHQSVQR
ncbi:MAG TPA: ComEC/Rec2 family competence protein [Candidatus Didemnitutus sp.]|nr:ComEC/Rec2 family competence protein [Candidatus Didemnitutus sp.]